MPNYFREKLLNTLSERFQYDANCGHSLESEFQYVGDLDKNGLEYRRKYYVPMIEPINPQGQCLCGKKGLKRYGVLLHKPTKITIAIGKDCIKNYINVTDLICQDCQHVCLKNSMYCPSCDAKHKKAITMRLQHVKKQMDLTTDLCNLQMPLPVENYFNVQERYLMFLYHPSFNDRVNDEMIERLYELLQLRKDTIEELYNLSWNETQTFREKIHTDYCDIRPKIMGSKTDYPYSTNINSNNQYANMHYLFDLVDAQNKWNTDHPDFIY